MHDGDDKEPKEGRAATFLCCREHGVQTPVGIRQASQPVLPQTEPADDVSNHDYRTIDDLSEVDRPKLMRLPEVLFAPSP